MDRNAVAGIEDALVDIPEGLETISIYASRAEPLRHTVFVHPTHGPCHRGSAPTFAEAYRQALAQWRKPIPADILLTAYGSAVDSFGSRTRTGEA